MSGYGDFACYYDALTGNVGYEQRSEYYLRLLHSLGIRGGILLDLACGTGSLSVLMAKSGFDVIAADASFSMLSVAQNKAFENDVQLLFLCQPMQQLDLYGTINAAICTLDSINHLTIEADVIETFRRVSLFLEPGGAFIFDVNTVYKHREILADNTFVYDTPEVYCVWQNSLNEDDSVDITLDFFEEDDGAYYRSYESFSERAYPLSEIENWLSAAGLSVMHIYDELTQNDINDTTQRAVIVAVKPEKD